MELLVLVFGLLSYFFHSVICDLASLESPPEKAVKIILIWKTLL